MNPNLDLVRGMYRAFGTGDIPALLAACDPDISWRVVGNPEQATFFGQRHGRDGVLDFVQQLVSALSDIVNTPQQFHALDDKVFVSGNDSATARSSGKRFSVDWLHVFTIRNGLVCEFVEYYDTASIVAALGQQP